MDEHFWFDHVEDLWQPPGRGAAWRATRVGCRVGPFCAGEHISAIPDSTTACRCGRRAHRSGIEESAAAQLAQLDSRSNETPEPRQQPERTEGVGSRVALYRRYKRFGVHERLAS